jgi:hypothetical protein
MAEAKKRTYRSTAFAKSGKKESPETRQVVVTLSVPDGDVLKVETLDKAGHRQPMPEEEFAALAGDDDAEELGAVLEGAYTAGISDALNEEMSENEEAVDDDEEEIIRRFMIRRAAGRHLLRSGMRKLILRRRLRRDLIQRRAKPGQAAHPNGVKE